METSEWSRSVSVITIIIDSMLMMCYVCEDADAECDAVSLTNVTAVLPLSPNTQL